MGTGLEEAWQNLTLTEDEEKTVTVDDEEDLAKDEQIALCLLGRLHTDISFNTRAMKSILRNVWKPSKGLVIRDLDSNLFVFQFFNHADKEYVLNEGPWAFDGHILLLKQMSGLEIPSEVVFTTACFWVKAYDVPGKKQTTSFARALASNVGALVSYDESTTLGIDKALCFRVDIDVTKPLRLPDFCYDCGKLGHVLKGCETVEAEEGDLDLQYGAWLRASPMKSRRRNMESQLAEEKRLFRASRS
ncbi:hypothetical protein Cgig2_015047 [Carnegiea gigantea]|uniref:CCHC-type domain-containing protein n=1 Tax=Carnegiea gigantea TaxID=171969 RepID=A0A9Q1K6J8_9CARY|nr:hypothetical protein Cgig2_015047 [Carnegiea gigantea]